MGIIMKIFGLQKLTLIDYPGKAAATVFLSGCDFKCPFCHNAVLMKSDGTSFIEVEELLTFLDTRRNLLDGVCISGGEPLLQDGVIDFISKIKKLGFDIKLDTNGNNPNLLKKIAEAKLIDYVAMDIKSSLQNYSAAVGLDAFCSSNVEESAKFLLNGTIPYEFRTTVVREFHKADDFHSIGKWLQGAGDYFLQAFVNTDDVPNKNLSAYDTCDMKVFCDILKAYNINAQIRHDFL